MALTPFMSLLLPDVGVTLGPTWASELDNAFFLVDSHNHTVGQGVPIPSAGISINGDLPFNSFNATLLRSTRFVNQSSPLSGPQDLVELYGSSGNLYWNNAVGQQVQITAGAGLNAASIGGIGGDYGTSTASVFYTSADSTFTFWQAPNQMALIQSGPLELANTDQDSFFVTFQAPIGLTASYTLTLPTGLPSSGTSFLTTDSSGNIGDVIQPDDSTIQISGNVLQVVPGGITDTQIATSTITVDKLAPSVVGSPATLGNVLQLASNIGLAHYASMTMVSQGTITTAGRPIDFRLSSDFSGTPSYIQTALTSGANTLCAVFVQLDSNIPAQFELGQTGGGGIQVWYPSSSISGFFTPGAGTHMITVYVQSLNSFTEIGIFNTDLYAREV